MKKILTLLLLTSIYSHGTSHDEMYQKQIDFYKKMYEQEKSRNELIEKNISKIKEVNDNKKLSNQYKNIADDIIIENDKDNKIYFTDKIINLKVRWSYPNNPVSTAYSRLKGDSYSYEYGDFYNLGRTPYEQLSNLNYFTYLYNYYTEKKNIIKENLIQNLYDLADLIEDYTPNTEIEFDDNYNVYVNGELLK